jgi:hypothetical protein
MALVLKDCKKLYNDRKHKWILCDDSAIDYSKHKVSKIPPEMIKLYQLGFSEQFYLINIGICFSVNFIAFFGFEFWFVWN